MFVKLKKALIGNANHNHFFTPFPMSMPSQDTPIVDAGFIEKVCLYYGYPSSINDVRSVEGAINIFSQYDIVILGDGLNNPEHSDHDNTKRIISGIKTERRGIQVFGYVQIGMDGSVGSDLTMNELKTLVDMWKLTGATGIFLDEFGYDYLVTRERQNEIVSYCHQSGMNVIANSWEIDYVWSSENIYLSWRNFNGNPNNIAPVIGEKDYYLFENMFFKYEEKQKSSKADRVYEAFRYYQEPQDQYNGNTYYQQYKTKTIALDAIQHDHEEKEYMFNRGYLASILLNIDGYAPSVEGWTNKNFNHYFNDLKDDYKLKVNDKRFINISDYGKAKNVIYETQIDEDIVKMVWHPDLVDEESYEDGYKLLYLNDKLVIDGASSQPEELPILIPPDIATDGLVFYYNANEGVEDKSWLDLSGNNYNFRLVDTLKTPNGVYFDGVTARGVISSVPNQDSVTFEMGFELKERSSGTMTIINGFVSSGSQDNRSVSINSSGYLRFNDGARSIVTEYLVPLDTHIIITFRQITDTSLELYVDGVLIQVIETANPAKGITNYIDVATNGGSTTMSMNLTFVRQYSRSLTDEELVKNYSVGTNVWNIDQN